jgi:hypothetical protein
MERKRASSRPFDLYRYAVWFKANPRGKEYMHALFTERFPSGVFVDAKEDPEWRRHAAQAETVVLLYPDAIGIGFTGLEREMCQLLKPWAAVRVLNGRRREFLMSTGRSFALMTRRLLERLMLTELLFTLVFICISPLLLMSDFLRGRR